jgi:hypothetical protein
MEKVATFLFPILSDDDRASLRRMIRAQRFATLKRALAAAKDRKLNLYAAETAAVLEEIVAFSKRDPEAFKRLFDDWLMPFCLARLLRHRIITAAKVMACRRRRTDREPPGGRFDPDYFRGDDLRQAG